MGKMIKAGKFEDKKGSLYRMDPDGSVHKLDDKISLSNGMCFDERERAFYYVDSFEYAVRRYDYDVATGNISNSKIIFNLKDHDMEGILDGMTIDTDGNLWIAHPNGHQVLKLDPRNGKLLQKMRTPALQTTSCIFGGPDFDELYVTTGYFEWSNYQKTPLCGATFKITGLGVKGLPGNNVRLK